MAAGINEDKMTGGEGGGRHEVVVGREEGCGIVTD